MAVYDEKLISRFHLLGDDDSGLICTPPLLIAADFSSSGDMIFDAGHCTTGVSRPKN